MMKKIFLLTFSERRVEGGNVIFNIKTHVLFLRKRTEGSFYCDPTQLHSLEDSHILETTIGEVNPTTLCSYCVREWRKRNTKYPHMVDEMDDE